MCCSGFGRIIDRYGPRAVLLASALLFPASLIAIVAAVSQGASSLAIATCAAAAGACFPPITVCVRTFLRQRFGEDPLLSTAYSLDSVLIETLFIVGPLLVALFVAVASARLAIWFAAASGFAGVFLFLGTRQLLSQRRAPRC